MGVWLYEVLVRPEGVGVEVWKDKVEKLGWEGWELVSIIEISPTSSRRGTLEYWFKRRRFWFPR